MNFMPNDKYIWLSDRWNRSKDQMKGSSGHDQGIMDGMFAINQIPGLVTIWSCEGHPHERRPDDSLKGPRTATGYLMIGVRDQEALDKLFDIYRTLSDASGNLCHLIELKATKRGDISQGIEEAKKEKLWWPVWILNWPVFTPNKKTYFDRVNKSIIEVLNKQ